MTLPTFNITAASIGENFSSYAPELAGAEWSDRIARWLQQASSRLSAALGQLGLSVAEVAALDTSAPAYTLCQQYVEATVCAQVARAITLQEVGLSSAYARRAAEALDTLREEIEGALGEGHDPETMLGSYKAIRRLKRAAGHPRSRWYDAWRGGKT